MAMGQTSTITVFLGTSEELAEDQILMGDFFGELNRLTLSRGMYFRLVKWQWDGHNDPLRDYDSLVRESSLCLFLFLTSGGAEMERRFDAALKAFRSQGAPQIITWFKRVPRGGAVTPELDAFRQRLDQQLHHFYNTYEALDSVKLGMLLQVARDMDEENEGQETLAIEGNRACLWGIPLVNLSDVPVYQGWSSIHDVRRELIEGEAEYQRLRAAAIERPADVSVAAKLGRAAARRTELESALVQGERQFLEFMRDMARATAGELTERQRQAFRLAEQGRVDAAIAMLDEEEIARDRAAAEGDLALADAVREEALGRLRATVSEQLQLADLLGSQEPTPELWERIGSILNDAATCELRYQLGYQAQLKLGSYLYRRNRSAEGIPHLERVADWLLARGGGFSEQEARDAYWALLDLGRCWHDQHEWGRSLEVYDRLLAFVDQWRPTWRLWRADVLSAKGQALVSAHRFVEAASVIADALAGFKGLQGTGPRRAYCCNRLGIIYSHSGDKRLALDAYGQGIEIARGLPAGKGEANRLLLVTLLENRAHCLCDLNQNEEALRDIEEALPLERELAERDPALHRQSLASALVTCADAESNLRNFEDAERHYCEALALRRELYAQNAKRYTESLGVVLAELGRLYWLVGRSTEAEPLLRESIELRSPLYEREPLVYGTNLSITLSQLGAVYRKLGRSDEEITCERKALDIVRQLDRQQSGTHNDALAKRIMDLALSLEDSRYEETAALYAECRHLLESCVAAGKFEFLSLLADCRHNAGCFYGKRGDCERAVDELSAASDMYRNLYERQGGVTYLEDYSRCLNNLGRDLGQLGIKDRAAEVAREGVELTRELCRRNPERFLKLLARRERALADLLHEAGRDAEAAVAYGEAAETFGAVGGRERSAANALWWQAFCLRDVDARASIGVYRRAAEAFYSLADYESEAKCWKGVAKVQRESGRWWEAASAYRWALDAVRKAGVAPAQQGEIWWWLAICRQHLDDAKGQCAAYREAIRLYRADGDEDNAAKVERLLKKAESMDA